MIDVGAPFLYGVTASPTGDPVVAGGYDSVLRVWGEAGKKLRFSLDPDQPLRKSDL